jgi:hypothetical protein
MPEHEETQEEEHKQKKYDRNQVSFNYKDQVATQKAYIMRGGVTQPTVVGERSKSEQRISS